MLLIDSDRYASGEDDSEFDFRVFRWHRLEHTGHGPHAARHPWAPEAILDLEADPLSGDNSRRASPRPDELDASAASSVNIPALLGQQGSDSTDFVLSLGQINGQGIHSASDPLNNMGLLEGANDESWILGARATENVPKLFEDDFSRFMEQAGYATGGGADILSWLPT